MDPQQVPPQFAGDRLDAWLSNQLQDLSRTRIQKLIKAGHILVNNNPVKTNYILREADMITGQIPEAEPIELVPENIPLDIIFEDDDIIVINKPSGLVVHPAPGNYTGTLVNALLHHCTDLAGIGGELRPGIVHRLDKDTSGVMVAAKNEAALNKLANQFHDRLTGKQYHALVWGRPSPEAAKIEAPITRHTTHRKKMMVDHDRGRYALSIYQTMDKFPDHTLVNVDIKTGRTHQIRVHMAHRGHPIVGDTVYGKGHADKLPIPVSRQMLHARQLDFFHPQTNERVNFIAEWPPDMQNLLDALTTNGN